MQMRENENNYSPTQRVLDLKDKGLEDKEIMSQLQRERMNNGDISNAFDQASLKNEINQGYNKPLSLDEVPSPSDYQEETEPIDLGMSMPTSPSRVQTPIQTMHSTTFAPEPAGRASYEMVEQIAESVIAEKWEDMVKNIGDLRLWKERVETDLAGVKQEILRVQSRFENLQKAVLGKVGEYSQGITDLNAEIKAMEKVFERILGPLTKSVKDLEKVTEKIKR